GAAPSLALASLGQPARKAGAAAPARPPTAPAGGSSPTTPRAASSGAGTRAATARTDLTAGSAVSATGRTLGGVGDSVGGAPPEPVGGRVRDLGEIATRTTHDLGSDVDSLVGVVTGGGSTSSVGPKSHTAGSGGLLGGLLGN